MFKSQVEPQAAGEWFHFQRAGIWTVIVKLTNRRQFSMVYLTNRSQAAVRLFSNRSQMTSKCGKNKKVAHEPQASVSLMFLPHFDVFCDLLLNRRTATWNLFVLYNEQKGNTTNLPRSAWLFDLCQFRHFQSHQRYFPCRLLLFFFIVLVNSFLLFFFPRPSLAQSRII